MTPHDINRTLAEFMGIDWDNYLKWCYDNFEPIDERRNYCENRNDLAEVLAKLTDDRWKSAEDALYAHYQSLDDVGYFGHWLLTCDPAIIAEAVAEVVKGTDAPAAK